MNIQFKQTEEKLTQMQAVFNNIGPAVAMFMNHYELAMTPESHDLELEPQDWKEFIMDSRVSEWLEEELKLHNEAQLRKLMKDSVSNQRSVGTAQMIKALQASIGQDMSDDGPIFIYSYVPLNHQEAQAPNVREEDHDIFWEED